MQPQQPFVDWVRDHARADLPNFIPPEDIPGLSRFLEDVPGILTELLLSGAMEADMTSGSISHEWTPWPDPLVAGNRWHVLPLKVFGQYRDVSERFPITRKCLDAWPELITASFSRLRNRTAMKPHFGMPVTSKDSLRVQIGLIVPGRAVMCVGGDTEDFRVGKPLVFDEMQTHFAYNEADQDRITILLDVPRPEQYPFKDTPDDHWSKEDGVIVDETDMIKDFARNLLH